MPSTSVSAFEHEFLVQLAPVWLGCRWKVMGHPLHGWYCKLDLAFDLLGMWDYAREMQLLCAEINQARLTSPTKEK